MLARVLPSAASPSLALRRAYASAAGGHAVSKPARTFVGTPWGSGLIPMLGESPISEETIRKHFVTTEWSKDLAAIKGHAPEATELWRKISFYIGIPVCIAMGIFAYRKEMEHSAHIDHEIAENGGKPLERVSYEYNVMRKRPLPWGTNQSLFHSDKYNVRASEEFGGE